MPLPTRARRALWRLSVASNAARKFYERFTDVLERDQYEGEAQIVADTARAWASGSSLFLSGDWWEFRARHVEQVIADLREEIDRLAVVEPTGWTSPRGGVAIAALHIKRDIEAAVAAFESVDLDQPDDLGRLWSF